PRRYFYERLDSEVGAAVEAALGVLRGLGAEIRDIELASSEPAIHSLFAIVLAEARQIHAERLASRPEDFGRDVMAILSRDLPKPGEVVAALEETYKLSTAMRLALESVDVLVTPTTPVTAVKIGQETVRYGGREEPTI